LQYSQGQIRQIILVGDLHSHNQVKIIG